MADDEEKKNWRVVKTIPESKDVTSVIIEPPEGEAAHHKAGQFASIRIMTQDGWSEPHPFTISCDATNPNYRFTIKNVGDFTASVQGLKPGTPVQCSKPLGAFCEDIENHEHIVMIAGGVGITPFLSVLRTFRSKKADNQIKLFWANKTLDDAFAVQEISQMTKDLNLQVIHVLSRQKELPGPADDGNVHIRLGHLSKEMLQEFDISPTASYYVCGPPAMQQAILGMLQSCGIDPGDVQREAFSFNQNP